GTLSGFRARLTTYFGQVPTLGNRQSPFTQFAGGRQWEASPQAAPSPAGVGQVPRGLTRVAPAQLLLSTHRVRAPFMRPQALPPVATLTVWQLGLAAKVLQPTPWVKSQMLASPAHAVPAPARMAHTLPLLLQ